jgi:hypothetical protein
MREPPFLFSGNDQISAGARKVPRGAVSARTDAMARNLPDKNLRQNLHVRLPEKNSGRVEVVPWRAGREAPTSCAERNGVFRRHGSRRCCSRFSLLPPGYRVRWQGRWKLPIGDSQFADFQGLRWSFSLFYFPRRALSC